MRRVRYVIGMSLDGFIATPSDGTDWQISDPEYSSEPFLASVDTVLMGRRCYELAVQNGMRSWPGYRTFVFSRTLRPADYPEVTIVADVTSVVAELKEEAGDKDIWLLGGGQLFRSLLDHDLVDTVEVGVSPILLGDGVPLIPAYGRSVRLDLVRHKVYASGLAVFEYNVNRAAA